MRIWAKVYLFVWIGCLLFLLNGCTVNSEYWIHFETNGSDAIESIKTDGQSTITLPADPTKEDYVFVGWYWDNNTFIRLFTADSLLEEQITTDITIYAKWEVDTQYDFISAEGFSSDGNTLYTKCSNDVDVFDFNGKIVVGSGATWTVTSDVYGNAPYLSKMMALNVGDNIAYLWVIGGGDTTMFTLTIRRKPMYTITFNTNGGTFIPSQQVEEDLTIDAPDNPTRFGYTFSEWNFNFDTSITENVMITAQWDEVLVAYIDGTSQVQHIGFTEVTHYSTAGNKTLSGWYVLSGTVSGQFTLTVNGEAHLILMDDCDWTVNQGGIVVSTGNTLNIYAQSTGEKMGKFSTNANIGGKDGAIGIAGITATPGTTASGTDGGWGGNGFPSGTITINGGLIYAKNIGGGDGGRGGSGGSASQYTVTGVGGSGGAGGDGGAGGKSTSITINGGVINATNIGGGNSGNGGHGGSAALGSNGGGTGGRGGNSGFAGLSETITIHGGLINAQQIGGGKSGNGGTGGNGFVQLSSGNGGRAYSGGDSTTLTIHNGTINAINIGGGNGGNGGAGAQSDSYVGGNGGFGGNGGQSHTITITGGTLSVTTIGGGNGGFGGNGGSSRGIGADFSAGGGGGDAGFGGGSHQILISGGTIQVIDNIGGGNGNDGGNSGTPTGFRSGGFGRAGGDSNSITISGGTITATNIGGGNGGKGSSTSNGDGGDSASILITSGTITVTKLGGGNGGNNNTQYAGLAGTNGSVVISGGNVNGN